MTQPDTTLARTVTMLVAGNARSDARWGSITVQELAKRLEAAPDVAIAASQEGFAGLARLLSGDRTPDAYDALAHAAMLMAHADSAWLLVPMSDQWTVIGRAHGPDIGDRLRPDTLIRKVPLVTEGQLVGALAFWYVDGAVKGENALEGAFEAALAAALRSREQIEESLHDSLTGLLSRRTLDDTLKRAIALSRRMGHPLAVLMLDLDHFKRVNDEHGHDAGDQVLKAFGGAVLAALRASDSAVRYGGEEVAVILPDTGPEAAIRVAEKLRAAIGALDVSVKGATVRPTVSIGVAVLEPEETPSALLTRADQALYAAKAAGRNCVRLAESSPTP